MTENRIILFKTIECVCEFFLFCLYFVLCWICVCWIEYSSTTQRFKPRSNMLEMHFAFVTQFDCLQRLAISKCFTLSLRCFYSLYLCVAQIENGVCFFFSLFKLWMDCMLHNVFHVQFITNAPVWLYINSTYILYFRSDNIHLMSVFSDK